MKAIKKITTTAALVLCASAAMATGINSENRSLLSDTEVEVLEAADKGNPVFRLKGEKLYLNLLNLQGEKVRIRVYDSAGRLLFKETVTGDLTVEKAFNFESAIEDNYTVVVKDSNGTYLERVAVR